MIPTQTWPLWLPQQRGGAINVSADTSIQDCATFEHQSTVKSDYFAAISQETPPPKNWLDTKRPVEDGVQLFYQFLCHSAKTVKSSYNSPVNRDVISCTTCTPAADRLKMTAHTDLCYRFVLDEVWRVEALGVDWTVFRFYFVQFVLTCRPANASW